MYGGSIAEFMYLFDMLEDELGIHVECTARGIAVSDAGIRHAEAASPARPGASARARADLTAPHSSLPDGKEYRP